jgi:prepilin-type N-terminal cleavage/methylation domain-containing protein/prepilin-type processing-associated H-X9-DG protein
MLTAIRNRRTRIGFTLIELLVVVAIIALLISILLPSLNHAREQAKEVADRSNLRQILLGMMYYAEDHDQNWYMFNVEYDFGDGQFKGVVEGQPFVDELPIVGADSAVSLAMDYDSFDPGTPVFLPNSKPASAAPGQYIRDWGVLTCPSTNNRIEVPQHLNNNVDYRREPNGGRRSSRGHSYEFWNGFQLDRFGYENNRYESDHRGGDDDDRDGFPDCLKKPSVMTERAEKVILVLDGDDIRPELRGQDKNNFPDHESDNHGGKGWNAGFADGHVAWYTPNTTMQLLFESDMDYWGETPPEYRQPWIPPEGNW